MSNYFEKFNNGGIAFMEGRDKGNLADMLETPVHIIDYGFIKNDEGEYAVMLFAEDDKRFYFGNSIITEMLKTIESDGMKDALAEQPIRFFSRESKKGRTYTGFRF